ncbi:MAG: FmdB family zinc ribbon protein [Desulfobulbus sp.]|jgi:putative FmdB family regulatory protein
MPVYEYECKQCEQIFEVQQRITDAPITTCPECGGEVRKLISMSSFHLKGGGWYTDGYSADAPPCAGGESCGVGDADSATSPPPCASGGCCCGTPH